MSIMLHNIIRIHKSVSVRLTVLCGIFLHIQFECGEYSIENCQSHMNTLMDMDMLCDYCLEWLACFEHAIYSLLNMYVWWMFLDPHHSNIGV
jgi:hypothetical protein